jgi:hypothetical protein
VLAFVVDFPRQGLEPALPDVPACNENPQLLAFMPYPAVRLYLDVYRDGFSGRELLVLGVRLDRLKMGRKLLVEGTPGSDAPSNKDSLHKIVWDAVRNYLPKLMEEIQKLLNE